MNPRDGAVRSRTDHNDVAFRVLELVDAADGPVGAGSIYFKLRADGIEISTPTVGRLLRDLEVGGSLAKVGVEGRTLTPSGRSRLKELREEAALRAAGQQMLGAFRRRTNADLINLLEARRPLEREVARLAAERATDQDVLELENIAAMQQEQVAAGLLASAADVQFHERLASATGNPFMHALVALLRNHGTFAPAIARARVRAGHELGIDHRRILDAVRSHDARRAEALMDDHISQLIVEVSNNAQRRQRRDFGDGGGPDGHTHAQTKRSRR